ncbi:VOC family protein [Aeromonas dhakensis]|uniref:VOC family protein n=1 Tax=Aeromonas dhakensis TaxID=196024 RepID=UPI0038CF3C8B
MIGRHLAMEYHCANEETSGCNPTFTIAVHVEVPLTEVVEGIKVAKFQDPEGNRIALQERWPPAS